MALFLPSSYTSRHAPEYVPDNPSGIIHQPHVYEFAKLLALRMGITRLVDLGAGSGLKLRPLASEFEIVAFDFGENLEKLSSNLPGSQVIKIDLENPNELRQIEHFLSGSLVIFSDVIEHLVNPEPVLELFARCVPNLGGIVISTPERLRARGPSDLGPPANPSHVREWEFDEFRKLLGHSDLAPLLHGYTVNSTASTSRNTQVAFVPGGQSNLSAGKGKTPSVLAIVPCFNEVDIIRKTVLGLISLGMEVHIIDNWSTDGTWEKLQKYFGKSENVRLERFPESKVSQYQWQRILRRVSAIAAESSHDWVLHVDADEILESPVPGMSVLEIIQMADSGGFNIIDFTLINFRPSKKSTFGRVSLDNWEFGNRPAASRIERAWKNSSQLVDLATSGGHVVGISNRKVFPINLLLRHFPLRNPRQSRKKIFADRIPRFLEERKSLGFHTQYDSFSKQSSFFWSQDDLQPWNSDCAVEWIPEFTTRAGINFESQP